MASNFWWEEIAIYEKLDAPRIGLGSIVYAPVRYLNENEKVIRGKRLDDGRHNPIDFETCDLSLNSHFCREEKLPVKGLGVGATEEAIIVKCKKRPCIVFKAPNIVMEGLSAEEKKSFKSKLFLIPIYSLEDEKSKRYGGYKKSPKFIEKITHLVYDTILFLPKTSCETRALTNDSFAKIDEPRTVLANTKLIEKTEYKISDDYYNILEALFKHLFFNVEIQEESDERAYLDLIQEPLKSEG